MPEAIKQFEVEALKALVRTVPDFPKPGILFYDISTLLAHGPAWRATVEHLDRWLEELKPDLLIGIESRGFLISAPLAYLSGRGFAMVRKRGKLPGRVIPFNYDLEYGTDTVEIQADAVRPGQRVVVLDDLLATGGTMAAAISLLRAVGANVVGAACIIELAFLNGRERIDTAFESVVSYDS